AIRAGRRTIETSEDVHERRLPGSRRPDDGDELAARDVERDAAEGVHRRALHVVGFREVLDRDQRAATHVSPKKGVVPLFPEKGYDPFFRRVSSSSAATAPRRSSPRSCRRSPPAPSPRPPCRTPC